MTTHQTTFVLVTGAWHTPSCFDPLAKLLREAGYEVVSKKHPSVGGNPPVASFDPDVEVIRQPIEEEADKGQNVILLMHSYGGVPGTEACKGLDKNTRARGGKKGGVTRLIYCTAFMLQEEQPLVTTTQSPKLAYATISEDMATANIIPGTTYQYFYNDLAPEHAAQAESTLQPHSVGAWTSQLRYAAWKDIPTLYILCTLDRAITIEDQRAMVQAATETGAVVETVTLEASHSPFLSMPERVVEVCVKAAEESL